MLHVKQPGPDFYRANKAWTWFFNRTGFAAVTMPWRAVYLHPDYIDDARLRRHETAHVAQINRDGPWLWSLKIAYYLVRYGYRRSPYEIEARDAENMPGLQELPRHNNDPAAPGDVPPPPTAGIEQDDRV